MDNDLRFGRKQIKKLKWFKFGIKINQVLNKKILEEPLLIDIINEYTSTARNGFDENYINYYIFFSKKKNLNTPVL